MTMQKKEQVVLEGGYCEATQFGDFTITGEQKMNIDVKLRGDCYGAGKVRTFKCNYLLPEITDFHISAFFPSAHRCLGIRI